MARGTKGNSASSKFRKIYEDHPEWIHQTSNDEVKAEFQRRHPEEPLDEKKSQILANVKSDMRKRAKGSVVSAPVGRPRGRPGRKPGSGASATATAGRPASASSLETLEDSIDECLSMAKRFDRSGLEDVIRFLRRARNGVVLRLGGA